MTKTWNLTLTPGGMPAATVAGLSTVEAATLLTELVHDNVKTLPRAKAHDERTEA